jgi:hypothetical protein
LAPSGRFLICLQIMCDRAKANRVVRGAEENWLPGLALDEWAVMVGNRV